MSKFKQFFLPALISGSVAGAIVGSILKWQFEKDIHDLNFSRNLKTQQLSELVGPVTMHFARTKAVAKRYGNSTRQFFGDALILKESNDEVLALLIAKGHLMPRELLERSQCLIVHYDIWLKLFEATMQRFEDEYGRAPQVTDTFDVGFAEFEDTDCGDFPEDVPNLYRDELDELVSELFENVD